MHVVDRACDHILGFPYIAVLTSQQRRICIKGLLYYCRVDKLYVFTDNLKQARGERSIILE